MIVGDLTSPIGIAILTQAIVMLVKAAASQHLSQLPVLLSLSDLIASGPSGVVVACTIATTDCCP